MYSRSFIAAISFSAAGRATLLKIDFVIQDSLICNVVDPNVYLDPEPEICPIWDPDPSLSRQVHNHFLCKNILFSNLFFEKYIFKKTMQNQLHLRKFLANMLSLCASASTKWLNTDQIWKMQT